VGAGAAPHAATGPVQHHRKAHPLLHRLPKTMMMNCQLALAHPFKGGIVCFSLLGEGRR